MSTAICSSLLTKVYGRGTDQGPGACPTPENERRSRQSLTPAENKPPAPRTLPIGPPVTDLVSQVAKIRSSCNPSIYSILSWIIESIFTLSRAATGRLKRKAIPRPIDVDPRIALFYPQMTQVCPLSMENSHRCHAWDSYPICSLQGEQVRAQIY